MAAANDITAVLELDSAAALSWASQLPLDATVTLIVSGLAPQGPSPLEANLEVLLRELPRAATGQASPEDARARLAYAAEHDRLRLFRTEAFGSEELISVETTSGAYVFERQRGGGPRGDSERATLFVPEEDGHHIDALRQEIQAILVSAQRVGGSVGRAAQRGLRGYQEDALAAWLGADGRGLLAMATGTGKTLTAMEAIDRLAADVAPLATVVIAPLTHLVDQWVDRFGSQGTRAIACHTSTAHWVSQASREIDLVRARVRDRVTLVATYASFELAAFRDLLDRIPEDSFALVVDEAHNAGSETIRARLPEARYRLGLTATPERWADPAGTRRLEDYFGGVVFTYTLTNAIADGVLAPYRYVLHGFELAEDELGEFKEASEVYAGLLARQDAGAGELERARRRRADVLDVAAGKVDLLRRALRESRPDRTVIYCSGREQLDAAIALCWEEGYRALPFTGEESARQRRDTLARFSAGDAPILGAIRCLDEGVDIPEAREAYLLKSSGNPAQYIQRRGRLLRRAPGKHEAVIHDVVPRNGPPEVVEMERDRVDDFAAAASNGSDALVEFERIVGSRR